MFAAGKTDGVAAVAANYIEDVFSTYLYTGNGTSQTITNGIDLSGKGGLTWIKERTNARVHILTDTVRGAGNALVSNSTDGNWEQGSSGCSFGSTGFSVGDGATVNSNTFNYVSWTWRKQPKYFDIQTWTGSGVNRTIAHNLGSVPGCILVKRTVTDGFAWQVYHRSLANTEYLVLNTTAAKATGATRWNSTTPTSTEFSLGTDATVNNSGSTYVAYLFAHDAGGFGLTGTDNVISCGSYTGNGSTTGPVINLGYEPQWLMIKNASGANEWVILDNMRGIVTDGVDPRLFPNNSDAENTGDFQCKVSATGFQPESISAIVNTSGSTYIYIAIRRGPMKVPTSGTSVLGLNARGGSGANATVTGGAGVSDAVLVKNRGSAVASLFSSRLTGTGYLVTSSNAAEVAAGTTILQANPWDVMDGVKVGTTSTITNASANTYINYLFKRAPSVFDEVCYTGTGSATTQTHNLGAAPELIIVKGRSALSVNSNWCVYCSHVIGAANTGYLNLNSTDSYTDNTTFWGTAPTSSVFSLSSNNTVNENTDTFVAYLFATCAGVSKVNSYTGNGSTQTIDCGFTGGARFVLIKRTDASSDWYVYDTARGMTVLTDPYLRLNTTAVEAATLGSVTTVSTGFALNSSILADINVSSGTYIFLAIA
jgi:hypothetical protein